MSSFKYRGRNVLVVFFLVLVLFLLFGSVLLFTMIISWDRLFRSTEDTSSSSQYKYMKLDPRTNTTVGGLVTLTESLGSENYRSYVDSRGHISLISNFEDTEYECHGECYCEEDDDDGIKRRTAMAVQRGLVMLVAAVSSVLALNIAQDRFAQECYDKYRHTCEFGVIIPGIPFCKKVFDSQIKGKISKYQKDQEPKGEATVPYYPKIKEWRDIRTFYCEARCTESYFQDEELFFEAKYFGCHRIKVMGEMSLDLTKVGHSIFDQDEHTAFLLEEFEKKMVAHCRSNSLHNYDVYDEDFNLIPMTVGLCSAVDEDGFNETVNCTLISLGKRKGQEIANDPDKEEVEEGEGKKSGGFNPIDYLTDLIPF